MTISNSLRFKRAEKFNMQLGRCFYCDNPMYPFHYHKHPSKGPVDKRKVATQEHLKPRSQGGGNHPDNWVVACLRCNSARGTIPWELFARYVRRFGLDHDAPALSKRRAALQMRDRSYYYNNS